MINIEHDKLEKEFDLTNKHMEFFIDLAKETTGIIFSDNKKDMIYSRLVRRLRALKLNSFTQYCDLLKSREGKNEIDNFINAVTTNLTSFFRESHHFDYLKDELLNIVENHPTHKIRIWSAAASSGMEAYSIAMIVKSIIPDFNRRDIKILATDIDTNMIEAAIAGIYSDDELENIPKQYRGDVFHEKEKHLIEISGDLKKMIVFKSLNLLQDWPMKGMFDIVFCRNVVIYFDKETQKILFDRIANIMNHDGVLYIGHSENLYNICDRFCMSGRTIYRKIK